MMRFPYGFGHMTYTAGGWWVLMFLFWLLVIAGIVVLIVWAVRQSSTRAHGHNMPPTGMYAGEPPARPDEACEIARLRYAKGEITKEQYEEMCRTLGVSTPPPMAPGPPPSAPSA